MAVTIFARGLPISAVGQSDDQVDMAVNGTTIAELRTTGISARSLSATSVHAATLCGTTAASAINFAAMSYTGGNSATLSGVPGTITLCADHFIKATLGGKTYYIPAYASAGAAASAV